MNYVILELGEVRKFWLQRGSSEIQMSSDAKALFGPWYKSLDRYYEHELFEILGDRLEVHCVKVALLYTALDRRETIETSDLKAANSFCEFLIESIAYIFSDYGWAEAAKQDRRSSSL